MHYNRDTDTLKIYYSLFFPLMVLIISFYTLNIALHNPPIAFFWLITFYLIGIISACLFLLTINKTFFSPALILSPEELSDCSALIVKSNHIMIKWSDLITAEITDEYEGQYTDHTVYLFANAVTYLHTGKTENLPQTIAIHTYGLQGGKNAILAKINEYHQRYKSPNNHHPNTKLQPYFN